MEKVILITSREISGIASSEFEEIDYGSIPVMRKNQTTQVDENGYFYQFLNWVNNGGTKKEEFDSTISSKDIAEDEKKSKCKNIVLELLRDNDPKEMVKPFKLGIFKREINSGATIIYLAEEFPCKGDKKIQFTENKQCYLNSIIMEIKNDMGNDTEIEWLILSHDNDWGKEGGECLKKKGSTPSIVGIKSEFSQLNTVVSNKEKTEIWAFRHVPEDDTYQFAKSLMEEKYYDFKMYLETVEEQRNSFSNFLKDIKDLENVEIEAFRDLKINPDIPFLPRI